jgi:hypothetical protein
MDQSGSAPAASTLGLAGRLNGPIIPGHPAFPAIVKRKFRLAMGMRWFRLQEYLTTKNSGGFETLKPGCHLIEARNRWIILCNCH